MERTDSGNSSATCPARIPRELSWNQMRSFTNKSRRLLTLRPSRTVARIGGKSNMEKLILWENQTLDTRVYRPSYYW
jgi:hypothetical protein